MQVLSTLVLRPSLYGWVDEETACCDASGIHCAALVSSQGRLRNTLFPLFFPKAALDAHEQPWGMSEASLPVAVRIQRAQAKCLMGETDQRELTEGTTE